MPNQTPNAIPLTRSDTDVTQPPTGKLIVVFGTKGGVGKTMVAINIAVCMAQRIKQPVCLVDLDLMAVGDVAKALNLSVTRYIVDVIPALKRATSSTAIAPTALPVAAGGPGVSLDGIVVPHSSGVHVVECLGNPRQLNQVDATALPLFFNELKRRYAYIVVDGGKSFSEPLIVALDAANLILLVATPDVVTLYQTKWALSMLEHLLFPSVMVKAVLNRAESRGAIGTEDTRAAISCEVIGQIPSSGRIVGTSMNQGVPLAVGFSHTNVTEAFERLAEVLTTRANVYIAHHEFPRHQRLVAMQTALPAGSAMLATRLYATEEAGSGVEAVDEVSLMKQRIHERLVAELDLKRLDIGTLSDTVRLTELRKKIEPVIANLLARELGGLVASQEVRARLVKEIIDEAVGLGPLEELLADPDVTDILVNNKDQVYVERHGRLELTNKKFISNGQVRAVIERIVAPLGRRVDEANPMVDARLPDGSRVNAIIPPLSIKGPVLSIRKFARQQYTMEDLIRLGTLTPPMAAFVKACVLARKNIIVSGGTGSGKTTLLNTISAFISAWERIITIEDAAELRLAQTHWVSLESRPPNIENRGQVMIRDLFRNALRMRPDRIIIGECRGEETLDMLQAMNTGHDGSLTTIHANSPRDVISRLDTMVLMSNVELPVRTIREMVASAIHIIVHTARLSSGARKITAISEIVGLTNEMEVRFQDIFVFHQQGVRPDGTIEGAFTATGMVPTFLDELKAKGVTLDPASFKPTALMPSVSHAPTT